MAKYVKKILRKAGRAIKKRYFKGKGYSRPKIGRMAKDIAIVKQMVNSEKEIYSQNISTNVGSVAGEQYFQPITNIVEGTGHGQRNGESVKLHGFRWNMRALQMTSRVNMGRVTAYLIKYIGPRGTTPAISTFLKPDFDGLYTVHSQRNEDWYSSYQVISRADMKVDGDSVSGSSTQSIVKRYGRFKGKVHQRYSGALATDLLTDQMYILIVTDGGSTATNTGYEYDCQLQISFYDN